MEKDPTNNDQFEHVNNPELQKSQSDLEQKKTEAGMAKITEGRFENVQFNELCKVLIDAPAMSFYEAIMEVGAENMPSIYDVASVKRFFYKRDKLDVLTKSGIIFEKNDPKFKQVSLEGKQVKGAAKSSHLENPDIRYMWTNEYIGMAPKGHPAEGKVIMAKISGIDMSKQIKHPMGGLASPDGMQQGEMIISDKEFIIIDETKLKHTDDGFNHGIRWCGEIQGFEEINGFMVPITFGRGPTGNPHIDYQTRYSEESKKDKTQGFGDLVYDLKGDLSPIAMRPSSWSSMGFNEKNPLSSKFKVLLKQDLDRLK